MSQFIVLYRLTKEMRKNQKAYFSDRTPTNLITSKECEKAVDEQLKLIEQTAQEKGVNL